MQQRKKRFRPKIPKWTEQRCQQQEVHNSAEQCGKEHINPKLTAADAQRKEKAESSKADAIERIKRIGQKTHTHAVHTDGAQQVIKKCSDGAQQQRIEQRGELFGQRHAHNYPPNRRENKPPRPSPRSS